jgi:fibrillarin-like rRNA methylase
MKPTISFYDSSTGETETREMNDTEYTQWQADQAKRAAEIVAEADKEASRQALLSRLGITADEAKLLLG